MPILIKRTGLEQYAPGGNARVKILVIGGPSVGKTRWSSFFPDPFYIDIEGGLASVADRQVPYASVNNSVDMADALQFLKIECRKTEQARDYQTVVIDTLDAYQRKVKNEWMEKNRVDTFTGWDAWGYLTIRMQGLMTKLLNLDMNVIVNVHYKDKVTKDDETKRETHEYMLQLQGEIADTAFNDFDFVGWMDEERAVVDGKPQTVRWISFEKTPQKPFLKDRLNVMDGRIPVTFSDDDYKELLARIASRMEGLKHSEDVGEIPSYEQEPASPAVVAPQAVQPAVLPRREPALETYDKAQLQKICRDEGILNGADGKPLRGNSLKSELLEAVKYARSAPKPPPISPPPAPLVQNAVQAPAPVAAPYRETTPATVQIDMAAKPQPSIKTPVGPVNPATGELLTPEDPQDVLRRLTDDYMRTAEGGDPAATATAEQALDAFAEKHPDVSARAARTQVEQVLGGTPIARTEERVRIPEKMPEPALAAKTAQGHKYADDVCKMCSKPLATEPFQPIQLGWIKFRQLLCEEHFVERRDAGK